MGVDIFASVRLDGPPVEMLPRQQRQHVAPPAPTRSGARRQHPRLGSGPGGSAKLAGRKVIHRWVAEAQPAAPAWPTGQACDVETPETHAQARSGPHHESRNEAMAKQADGARAVGSSGEEEGE